MTRLSGREARGLVEAYNNVYLPQKINENIEKLVDTLIEDGYDLSECTWDEIHDTYFSLCLTEAEDDIIPGQRLIGPAVVLL